MSKTEARLTALGVSLPAAAAPVANYVPFVITGSLLIISGQLPFGADGKLDPAHVGKVGGAVSVEARQSRRAPLAPSTSSPRRKRRSAISTELRVASGSAASSMPRPASQAVAAIMNGASDLVVEVLGDPGRHARSTVGVAELPLEACAEVEAIFEIAL